MLVFQRLAISPESVDPEAGDEVFSLYEHNLAVHPLQSKTQGNRSGKTPDLDSLSAVCTVYISVYISIYLSHLSMCPLNRRKKQTSLTSRARTNFSFHHPAAFLKPQASPSVGRRHGSSRFLAGRFPGLVFLALLGMRNNGIQQESAFNGPCFWH